jgi:tetratricopeptide (TPR) repeat protein
VYFASKQLELLESAEKPDAKAIGAAHARLTTLLGDLGPRTGLTAMSADVPIELAKSYLAKKYYQSAAFWLAQALGLDPIGKEAAALQDQILKNTTGDAALKMQKKLGERSPAWIARQDKAHRDFQKNPYEGRTKYYTVKTNVGYEVFQTIYWSMDQMNQFYRKVFGYKGNDPPVLTVQVFATREEFDKKREMPKGVKGWYDSAEIVSYDSRVDGFGVGFIYCTLFHEASHQFIDLITGTKPPMYLNEGISSYFEGARILPDGTVQTNEIPDHRIRGIAKTMDTPKEVSLEKLLNASKEQYDAVHYCYGWALIYYLLNKEDESAANPYRGPLMKLLDAYRKGGKHDVAKRFEDIVLKPIDGPKTVAELQPVWKKWMKDLVAEYRQGAAMAPTWIGRAEGYLEKGRLDKAEAALKRVLAWIPNEPKAQLLLARTYQRKKDDDRALYHLFSLRDQGTARGQRARRPSS